MTRRFTLTGAVLLLLTAHGCSQTRLLPQATDPSAPPPRWAESLEYQPGHLCGIGIAGAGFDNRSPYPRALSRVRSINNLAGTLRTDIREAIIDHQNTNATSIQHARTIHIDESLIETISATAETEYWLDHHGVGPFTQPGFTYALSCINARQLSDALTLSAGSLHQNKRSQIVRPEIRPTWLNREGKQSDGRLCAVGYSAPAFFADKTFENVVDDIRTQLSEVIHTLVSSYSGEISTARYQIVEAMTVASTQAVSQGAMVTHYWFDRDGIGPYQRKQTTYGWGCIYPLDVLQSASSAVTTEISPEEQDGVIDVRNRAQKAFESLEELEDSPRSAVHSSD